MSRRGKGVKIAKKNGGKGIQINHYNQSSSRAILNVTWHDFCMGMGDDKSKSTRCNSHRSIYSTKYTIHTCICSMKCFPMIIMTANHCIKCLFTLGCWYLDDLFLNHKIKVQNHFKHRFNKAFGIHDSRLDHHVTCITCMGLLWLLQAKGWWVVFTSCIYRAKTNYCCYSLKSFASLIQWV